MCASWIWALAQVRWCCLMDSRGSPQQRPAGMTAAVCRAGVVGIALALAGADALLVDLPHVTPLTRANVDANCQSPLLRAQVWAMRRKLAAAPHNDALLSRMPAQVLEHAWGSGVAPLGDPPDLITGADIVYQEEHFPALLRTLDSLAAPHTLIYLGFRLRGAYGQEG